MPSTMDRTNLLRIGVVVVVLLGLLAVPVAVAQQLDPSGSSGELTRGEPDLDAFLPEPELNAGTEDSLEVQISNSGELDTGTQSERVTTARALSMEVTDEGPFDVKSGASSLGSLPEGQTLSAAQRIEAPEDLEPGEYDITVRAEYAYTWQVSDNTNSRWDRTGSDRFDLTVVVPDEARFDVTDVDTDVQTGGDGPATVTVENVGAEPANTTEATISGGSGVTIDGGAAEEVLGDLAPNESADVTVDLAIAETTSAGQKPVDISLSYRDSAGIERQARPLTASLAPAAEQRFSIDDIEDTLSVGYDGEITGEITNDGPRTVDDAVLIVEPTSDSLFIEDTRYALPKLADGETTEFRFPTDVSGQADAGPRQLRFTVEYSAGDRSTLTDGPISERVVVDPREDEFTLDGVETTVQQGASNAFVLEVTNNRPETLRNIDANLYADSPLDTTDDDAFVASLDPGESTEIAFEIVAAESATVEDHPVELDFQYDTERGDTEVSDTYKYPVTVVEATETDDDGPFGLVLLTVGLLGAIGLALVLIQRYRDS